MHENEYIKNKCIVCGNDIPYERGNSCTCSTHCSRIKANKERGKHSNETKRKISESINRALLSGKFNPKNQYTTENNKGQYKLMSECISLGILENHNNVNFTDKPINIKSCKEHICPICGKIYHTYIANSGKLTNYSACSKECLNIKMQNKVRQSIKKRIKDGAFIGWQSRNIISYPEKFFMDVLENNNICFEHNFHIKKYHYFLDFFIIKNGKLLDLEIDGKQHEYKDRKMSDDIRDINLKNEGYLVYRIKWNSINDDKGKQLMKDKIDKFIEFYDNL